VFFVSILDGIQLELGSFFVRQLHNVAVSTKGRIVTHEIMTTIARFLGIEPNPKDRVSGSERLDQAAFEIMNFCKVKAERLC